MPRLILAFAIIIITTALAHAQPLDPRQVVERIIRDETTALALFTPRLRKIQENDMKRDIDATGLTWITGGNDRPNVTNLRTEILEQTPSTATVKAAFNNYGTPLERTFFLVRSDDRWLVDDAIVFQGRRISSDLTPKSAQTGPAKTKRASAEATDSSKFCVKDRHRGEDVLLTRVLSDQTWNSSCRVGPEKATISAFRALHLQRLRAGGMSKG
jgi:hypothetical protein